MANATLERSAIERIVRQIVTGKSVSLGGNGKPAATPIGNQAALDVRTTPVLAEHGSWCLQLLLTSHPFLVFLEFLQKLFPLPCAPDIMIDLVGFTIEWWESSFDSLNSPRVGALALSLRS